jgi:Ser/Thr protein kinase RdoA (MazF antagonist)
MLFQWIGGRRLLNAMSSARAYQLGWLAAVLHDHAEATTSGVPPKVLVADRVLHWLVDDRLDELAPGYGELFREALDRTQQTLDALWSHPPHAPHLIHGDLTSSNVIVQRDNLVVIDFQDLVWGLEIQDLAITLRSLSRSHGGGALLGPFRSGYEQIRPWPQLEPDLVDTLTAGRWLHQLNLGLNLRRPGLDQMTLDIAQLVGSWMAGASIVELP